MSFYNFYYVIVTSGDGRGELTFDKTCPWATLLVVSNNVTVCNILTCSTPDSISDHNVSTILLAHLSSTTYNGIIIRPISLELMACHPDKDPLLPESLKIFHCIMYTLQPWNTTCDLVIKSRVKIGQKLRFGVKIGSVKNSEGIFYK